MQVLSTAFIHDILDSSAMILSTTCSVLSPLFVLVIVRSWALLLVGTNNYGSLWSLWRTHTSFAQFTAASLDVVISKLRMMHGSFEKQSANHKLKSTKHMSLWEVILSWHNSQIIFVYLFLLTFCDLALLLTFFAQKFALRLWTFCLLVAFRKEMLCL